MPGVLIMTNIAYQLTAEIASELDEILAAPAAESLLDRLTLGSQIGEIDIEIADQISKEIESKGFSKLANERKAYFCTFEAETHLSDDGFYSLFVDESSEMLSHVAPSFQLIGAPHLASIFEQALGMLPGYPPIPPLAERERVVTPWWEQGENDLLDKLQTDYIESSTDGCDLRVKFALAHRELFFESD